MIVDDEIGYRVSVLHGRGDDTDGTSGYPSSGVHAGNLRRK